MVGLLYFYVTEQMARENSILAQIEIGTLKWEVIKFIISKFPRQIHHNEVKDV